MLRDLLALATVPFTAAFAMFGLIILLSFDKFAAMFGPGIATILIVGYIIVQIVTLIVKPLVGIVLWLSAVTAFFTFF